MNALFKFHTSDKNAIYAKTKMATVGFIVPHVFLSFLCWKYCIMSPIFIMSGVVAETCLLMVRTSWFLSPVTNIFGGRAVYIRDKYQHKERSREHLIKKRDIINIKRKLNVNCVHKHPNDLLSVCTWVEELKTLSYNPILAFKPQGDSPSTRTLAPDTFLLALQTQYQCNAFCKYGNKIVCMDSTHGTNIYDFLLISVLVVDDHGEGVPIAWAISNHETEEVLLEFLYAIKERVGELHPKVFMSDDAVQ